MKTKAAILSEAGKPFEIEELDLEGPREFEVLVRYDYSGLCHSDLHIMKGHIPFRAPMVFGHEGSGEVLEVGPGVSRVAPGDHFVAQFMPACGVCRWCASGRQNICDMGAHGLEGFLPGGRFAFTGPRGEYGAWMLIGTFSQYAVVSEKSLVRIDPDLPLAPAALVGCGVPTGWGAAVNVAEVRAGETVVVYGVGGIGMNAVQGARLAGAANLVAVDPVALKRENAERFGATHTAATAQEAYDLVQQLTNGVGADKAIICIDMLTEESVANAYAMISKGGTVVITSMGRLEEKQLHLPGAEMALFDKTVRGHVYGDCNPTRDIPRLLDLYRNGNLMLDELITRTYTLEQVNEGYEDLEAGKNIRGVIVHDHA
jgi:NDMA-dependent alcohol dehydrogenase